MDAVLLAASLSAKHGESLAEAGSGAGAALLCATHRLPTCHFTGFERDAAAITLAGQGIATNAFAAQLLRGGCCASPANCSARLGWCMWWPN